jgi:hypothetical protein
MRIEDLIFKYDEEIVTIADEHDDIDLVIQPVAIGFIARP